MRLIVIVSSVCLMSFRIAFCQGMSRVSLILSLFAACDMYCASLSAMMACSSVVLSVASSGGRWSPLPYERRVRISVLFMKEESDVIMCLWWGSMYLG